MSILVATLIDRAKLLSGNRRNAAISDTDWVTLINWSGESWDKFMVSLDPAFRFSTKDVTLTGGVSGSSVDLTTGFTPALAAVHGVDVYPDTSNRRTLRSRNFKERNAMVGWWNPAAFCDLRRYDLRGFTLVITPYESSGAIYRIYYRGKPYQFTGPADTTPLDSVLEPYTEAIVILAARMSLGIEETSQDPLTRRLKEIKEEVTASFERDDGTAFAIADVEDLGWGY